MTSIADFGNSGSAITFGEAINGTGAASIRMQIIVDTRSMDNL